MVLKFIMIQGAELKMLEGSLNVLDKIGFL